MVNLFRKGFSLIEIVIVIGIIGILISFASLNFFRAQNTISLNTIVSLLTSDIRTQQLNMMSGNVSGQSTTIPFGIHFDQNKYVLYHSSSYSSNDLGNFAINLGNGVIFSQINFPNSEIVFATESGEIQNFNQGQNTVTLQNSNSGAQKTVTVNRYGVVTSIQ